MNKNDEEIRVERTTETGEFIPSFDVWTEPHRQRKRAEKLAHVTERKPKRKNV